MKNLTALALFACLSAALPVAHAADSMKKDEMMKKDAMMKGEMKKDEMKKDGVGPWECRKSTFGNP